MVKYGRGVVDGNRNELGKNTTNGTAVDPV